MTIFCSGIGGIGLSAYAAIQHAKGHRVLGSDRSDSALLQDLRSQGIEVILSQDGSGIPDDCDLFVYTEAVPASAPERVKAKERGIPSLSYFQALGELTKDAFVIGVCGTHGKSSTTAMAARLLIEAGNDPSVVVGTKVPELGNRNWRLGKGEVFLVEACEYRRSFHFLHPDLILVTNVDGDHFDAYASVEEYQQAFVEFFQRLPEGGKVIGHLRDPQSARVIAQSGKKAIDADSLEPPDLNVPGDHMRQNGRLAVAMAMELGIDEPTARRCIAGFSGTWRRMEVKGKGKHGGIVIDDYAHHPLEIRASLAAIRGAYPGRIVCVFQPHTHDRTLKLYKEFLASFSDADVVIVPNVYGARPKDGEKLVDMPTFVADIARVSGKQVIDGQSLQATEALLSRMLTPDDTVVCMGAGDVTDLAARLTA